MKSWPQYIHSSYFGKNTNISVTHHLLQSLNADCLGQYRNILYNISALQKFCMTKVSASVASSVLQLCLSR